jgi:cell division transport system permease protein
LEEVGENPFGGSLRVKAKDSAQYEPIARLLEGDTSVARTYSPIIERINFSQNRVVLDRLSDLIRNTRLIGSLVTYLLALISIVVMYTTVRLTIYMVREEIGIMRLVGASASYVRGPFLVQGILYGVFSWIIAILLYIPVTAWVTRTAGNLIGFDLGAHYMNNIVFFSGILLVVGILLGTISSFLAVRKYLRV